MAKSRMSAAFRALLARGEVIVKPGFARNFLIPKGKAVQANESNRAVFEERRAELEAAANEKLVAAQARAEKHVVARRVDVYFEVDLLAAGHEACVVEVGLEVGVAVLGKDAPAQAVLAPEQIVEAAAHIRTEIEGLIIEAVAVELTPDQAGSGAAVELIAAVRVGFRFRERYAQENR